MIRAVLFDLNGIFVQSPKLSDRFAAQFGVSRETFLSALYSIMDVVRRPGAGDAFSFWQPYFAAWHVPLEREGFFSFWFSAEQLVPAMLRIAQELRKRGTVVAVVSNNFRERAQYYADHFPELFRIVNSVSYSWQTGFVKPDPRAFASVAARYQLVPDQCVCMDDAIANVQAAQRLGMTAVRFTTAPACREQLASLGLLGKNPSVQNNS